LTDTDGNHLANAKSRVVAPDEAYYAWWSENIDGLDEAGC
jgi:hypothetical protein